MTHRLWCRFYTRRQWAVQVLKKKKNLLTTSMSITMRSLVEMKIGNTTDQQNRPWGMVVYWFITQWDSISAMGTCDVNRTIKDDGNAGLLHQLPITNQVLSADFRKFYFSSKLTSHPHGNCFGQLCREVLNTITHRIFTFDYAHLSRPPAERILNTCVVTHGTGIGL